MSVQPDTPTPGAPRMLTLPVPTVWTGCYSQPWTTRDIVPAAFSHPAKASKALLTRILTYGLQQQYWQAGGMLLDPFGGIGTTAILGTYYGLRVLSCELEPRFHALAQENVALHRPRWIELGREAAWPALVRGDSRELGALLQNQGISSIVCSPPYMVDEHGGSRTAMERDYRRVQLLYPDRIGNFDTCFKGGDQYGQTAGQLGAMPAGSLSALLTSPPYAEGLSKEHTYSDHSKRNKDGHRRIMTEKGIVDPFYGVSPGNLGNLPAGQLAGIVTSPPYSPEALGHRRGTAGKEREDSGKYKQGYTQGEITAEYYSNNHSNLGNATGTTFWDASATILQQCHALLPAGAVAVFITKDYIRDKKRVPFSLQWAQLAEATGFAVVEWIQASLITDYGTEPTLFGGAVQRRVKKASFFRTLTERKYAPDDPRRIDHEDVWICRRKEAAAC